MTDDELQRKFESGGVQAKGLDEHAYQVVFNALKNDTEYQLASGFALRMATRIAEGRTSRRDLLWLVAGVVSFLIAACIAIVVTGFRPSFGVLTFLSGYRGLLIFGALLIIVFHWAEKKLIKKPS